MSSIALRARWVLPVDSPPIAGGVVSPIAPSLEVGKWPVGLITCIYLLQELIVQLEAVGHDSGDDLRFARTHQELNFGRELPREWRELLVPFGRKFLIVHSNT